ncbi:MAG: chemotaxis protein CheW [Desulfococcaceae bacterium]|jgi:chemotaxis-related protein WspD|nr:chemotaxis protein CheW [Desulfococcaceae bacterium]
MKETGLETEKENCWKTIGVFSKNAARCPRLEEVIHCRNCERFIHAGRNLLERELPASYLEERTRIIATKKEEESPGTVSVVIFRVEEEWLALHTRLFTEVVDPQKFHTLPHRKNPVLLGLVNVHGEIRICISLKNLLDIKGDEEKNGEKKQYKRMMVVTCEGSQWVFPVEEIHGIYRIHPDIFENTPVTLAKSRASFTRHIFRWRDMNVALLDDGLLFASLKRSLT